MQRRPPRTVWLPSLAGVPLILAGLWWMSGALLSTSVAGRQQWFVQVVLPAPTRWFQEPVSILGAAFLLVGLLLWGLSFVHPDPRRWLLVGSVYPEFMVAGHLLLLLVTLSVLHFQGHVFAATPHGVQWRSIAEVRSLANLWVAAGLGALALGAYTLSVGPVRRDRS